jgi:hypothetical protein
VQRSWRTIDQSAATVGGYCWQEGRLFELAGGWAGGEGSPEIRVWFSELSARHAFFAAQWRDRLPVRAGIDVPALIVAPEGAVGPALDLLERTAPDPPPRLGGLAAVLTHLRATYLRHLAEASPVNEAPVIAVLLLVVDGLQRESERGHALFQRELQKSEGREEATEMCRHLERLFNEGDDIVPAAHPS